MKTLNGPFLVLPFMATPPLPPISPNCREPLTCSPALQFLDPYLLKLSFGRAWSSLPSQGCVCAHSLWTQTTTSLFSVGLFSSHQSLGRPKHQWMEGYRTLRSPCKENPLHSISKCPPCACYPSIALLYCRMWLPTETTLSRLVMKHVCFSPSVTPHRLGRAVAGAAQKEDCLSHPGGSLRICKVDRILRQRMKNISDLEKIFYPISHNAITQIKPFISIKFDVWRFLPLQEINTISPFYSVGPQKTQEGIKASWDCSDKAD